MPEDAVHVGRPSRWGNPWRIGDPTPEHLRDAWFPKLPAVIDAQTAATLYADVLAERLREDPGFLEPLRDKVLACWCPVGLGTYCHADRIIEWFARHPRLARRGERPVFGVHVVDPSDRDLCATLVRGSDGGVLTQDICGHGRRDHRPRSGPRAGCAECGCRGFSAPVVKSA
jgi:hypothetical protein